MSLKCRWGGQESGERWGTLPKDKLFSILMSTSRWWQVSCSIGGQVDITTSTLSNTAWVNMSDLVWWWSVCNRFYLSVHCSGTL